MRREAFHRTPLQQDLSLGRAIDAGQDIEEGCLSGAVGSDQTNQLAGIDPERDIGESGNPSEAERAVASFQ